MMKKNIKKSIYAVCASLGFISALFTHTAASGADVILYHAADLLLPNTYEIEEVSATKFIDIDENMWYFPYVDMLVKNGVINGVSEFEYAPSGTFTAAECSAVITRYLGLEGYADSVKKELVNKNTKGSQLWYSGYVQTLFDTGIIKNGEFSISAKDGYVNINDENAFLTPIERHTFAVLISRSFDINTKKVTAKNLYPEICDNGNNFIVGGCYDNTVDKYADDISDYQQIPQDSRKDVLKAYYNGIFNGDEYGNFNPTNLLTRAEMSKVISVVIDSDLRSRKEYRNVVEIPADKFVKDGWGNTVIDRNYSFELLSEMAKNAISWDAGSGGVNVGYIPTAAPKGYFYDVRFYTKNQNTYSEKTKAPISQNEAIIVKNLNQPRVMIMLRNSDTAEVEGVLRVEISADGNAVFDNLFKPVI